MSFRDAVIEALTRALGPDAEGLDIAALLTSPPKAEMGDLAFPCFPLAKVRKAPPPKIAGELAAGLEAGGPIARVAAMGPYVNFFADSGAQLAGLHAALADGSFFESMQTDTPKRVMIEFSQPNTHKVFHVGHVRNVALGDALVRVFRARGHDVVAANYYGDFGIDVAKCLWWLTTHPQDPPIEHRAAWLGRAYTAATLAVEEAEAEGKEAGDRIKADIRAVLTRMEEGEPEITALYKETRQWCLDEFKEAYDNFGVVFDHDFFESELEEAGNAVVDEYLEKGVFVESQGAIICDLEDKKMPPALVRKSDGSSLYMTWDLALAQEKFDKFDIETSMYVVAAEQTLHFQQLFASLEKMGYQRAKDCRHVSYELVMLPEGKMSSRKGTAIPLSELRESIIASIEAKMKADLRVEHEDWSEQQSREIARKVGQACTKYGMLQMGNNRRVVFDMDAWTNPEGDTGAYLLYSLARIAGIHRKAGEQAKEGAVPAESGFGSEEERDLLNHLLAFAGVVERVESTCDPSHVAHWLFQCAKHFSRFYQQCPVLQAEPGLRAARLTLVACTETVMRRGLDLIGIVPVEAM